MPRGPSSECLRFSPRHRLGLTAAHSHPLQGLEPVGKGQAAAGLRAVLVPGDTAGAVAEATAPATGVTGLAAFLVTLGFAFLWVDFFLPAFLADLFNDFLLAFFVAALLFFFFFAAFLAFLFFAIADLRQELMEQRTEPARKDASYSTSRDSPEGLNSLAALLDIRSW